MPLRFLADENIEVEVVEALRLGGYDTVQVAQSSPGADDEQVLLAA